MPPPPPLEPPALDTAPALSQLRSAKDALEDDLMSVRIEKGTLQERLKTSVAQVEEEKSIQVGGARGVWGWPTCGRVGHGEWGVRMWGLGQGGPQRPPVFFLVEDTPSGQPPRTTNRQPPSAANRRQPPTANRQPPPTVNHYSTLFLWSCVLPMS